VLCSAAGLALLVKYNMHQNSNTSEEHNPAERMQLLYMRCLCCLCCFAFCHLLSPEVHAALPGFCRW
jgi:hypothetical protein